MSSGGNHAAIIAPPRAQRKAAASTMQRRTKVQLKELCSHQCFFWNNSDAIELKWDSAVSGAAGPANVNRAEPLMESAIATNPVSVTDLQSSGVSWPAVAAGAVGAAALTLLLVAFGAGLGLSAVSPWAASGVSAPTFKIGTGIYLVVVAVMASSVGGYLAARLRMKWTGIHTHEVYFRDTAHGFLAWAFATIISAGCSRRSNNARCERCRGWIGGSNSAGGSAIRHPHGYRD
jgi:hypothetical protein